MKIRTVGVVGLEKLYYLGSRVIETLSVMCKITAKPLS